MRARLLFLFVLSALVALVAVTPAASAAGGGSQRLRFHAPVVLPDTTGSPTEPSLAISEDGTRYPSWQSPGEFASSPDGVHFTNLGTPDPNAVGDVTNAVDASGAIYNAQICGDVVPPDILHTCVYRSTDGGHTWTKTVIADNHPGASDRPWIDVYPKHSDAPWDPNQTTVYLEYHTFSPDDLVYVTVSHDGGQTFGPPSLPEMGTNSALPDSGCNTIPSGVVVDQTTGTAYVLWLSGDDVVSNLTSLCNYSQIGPFTKAWVSSSSDGGLTWSANLAWHGAYDPVTRVGDNADKIFGTLSLDGAGQVHVVVPVRQNDDPVGFTLSCEQDPNCQEDPQPTDLLLVTSPDGGQTFTPPAKLTQRPGSAFFPWIAAGSSGIVDGVFYRTDSLRPNDPTDVWHVWGMQVVRADAVVDDQGTHYRGRPSVRMGAIDQDPIHIGGICTFGIFCSAVPNADRSLADSIAIALDPAGGANVAYTDNAEGDQRVPKQVKFACQRGGPSAFAGMPDLSGRCFGEA